MLGGIAFQLGLSAPLRRPYHLKGSTDRARVCPAAVSIYLVLATEFLLRYHYDKPFQRKSETIMPKSFALDWGVKLMIVGLAFDGVFILIR